MASAEIQKVPFSQLPPYDAQYLHPAHWGGHTVGVGDVRKYEPLRALGMTTAVTSAAMLANRVMLDYNARLIHPDLVKVVLPGQEFRPNEHPDKVILFDQSTLVSRGKPYDIQLPEQLPPPPFTFPPQVPFGRPLHLSGERMHYIREASPVMQVGKGDNVQTVRASSAREFVGMNREVPVQLGILGVGETVQVGQVDHLLLAGGHEMLTVTHNVYVLPKPA